MKRLLRTEAVRILLVCLSILLGLGLCELVLRIIAYREEGNVRAFVEYDALRGWRNVPNATGYLVTGEYKTRSQYNSQGMRGRELSYSKPPSVRRIILLGDSFVDGLGVEVGQRVSDVLEGMLNGTNSSHQFEVIAMGTMGYSTDQELLWLESDGWKYQPDSVVLMFFENDVWYNSRPTYGNSHAWPKPLFVVDGGTLRLTNVPVPRLNQSEKGESTANAHWTFRAIKNRIVTHSRIYLLCKRAVKSVPWLYGLAVKAGVAWPPPEYEPSDIENAWYITGLLLRKLKFEADRRNFKFIAFYVPPRRTVYTEELERTKSRTGGLAPYNLDPYETLTNFLRICQTESILCIDPTARFVESTKAEKGRKRLYYRGDPHWNESGHRVAAEILADQLFEIKKH